MIFSFDLLPARHGDCFLIHSGTKRKPGLLLVDGGPKQVYHPHLKPRLKAIRSARGLADNTPLRVDLLMVSHMDEDHILGILDLTRDLRNPDGCLTGRLDVARFWHNSFPGIVGDAADSITSCLHGQFGTASTFGDLPEDKTAEVEEACEEEDEEVVTDALKVLASLDQGQQLRGDAQALQWLLNPDFDGELVAAGRSATPVKVAGVTLAVAGPLPKDLEALRIKHAKWLADRAATGMAPTQALAAYIDRSFTNLSSIVVLAEAGGKRMLLTGDARGDKVLEGLREAGVLGTDPDAILEVDILKVPHHGSSNNLEADFFRRIRARHYVISGNGDYGNPEREMLEMLFDARGDEDYTVHLTYPVHAIDAARRADWDKRQATERKRHLKNPRLRVRPDWEHDRQSLAAFLAGHRDLAAKVSNVGPSGNRVIDLLDPLGF